MGSMDLLGCVVVFLESLSVEFIDVYLRPLGLDVRA
jgi:hypothetical protein